MCVCVYKNILCSRLLKLKLEDVNIFNLIFSILEVLDNLYTIYV